MRVREASTVICLRQRPNTSHTLTWQHMNRLAPTVPRPTVLNADSHEADPLLFGLDTSVDWVTFTSGWEVLMGQRSVVNWMRSTVSEQKLMRYPGEYVFAGGTVEAEETIEQAARRELEEEFGCEVPISANLRLFSVRQTRVIMNTSHIIYSFVACAEENPWLNDLNVEARNEQLRYGRKHHAELVRTGRFWNLQGAEREQVSPEVQRLDWLPLLEAVRLLYSSMSKQFTTVNEWQAKEFQRLGITKRDPMFLTLHTLAEIESFPSLASIRRYTKTFEVEKAKKSAVWLHADNDEKKTKTLRVKEKKRSTGKKKKMNWNSYLKSMKKIRLKEDAMACIASRKARL